MDSSLYRVHDDNRNISLYVANDSILTLLNIYSDRMSHAGRLITNCENCGQLMITKRSNASLTCSRTTCKKERLYKTNDDITACSILLDLSSVLTTKLLS